jgi:hypothetical protein
MHRNLDRTEPHHRSALAAAPHAFAMRTVNTALVTPLFTLCLFLEQQRPPYLASLS